MNIKPDDKKIKVMDDKYLKEKLDKSNTIPNNTQNSKIKCFDFYNMYYETDSSEDEEDSSNLSDPDTISETKPVPIHEPASVPKSAQESVQESVQEPVQEPVQKQELLLEPEPLLEPVSYLASDQLLDKEIVEEIVKDENKTKKVNKRKKKKEKKKNNNEIIIDLGSF